MGTRSSMDLPEMASAIAMVDTDRQLLFHRNRAFHPPRERRPASSGTARSRRVIPVTRSNDARVHPWVGAFWLGTMGQAGRSPRPAPSTWHRGGEVRQLFPDMTHPRIRSAFQPDGEPAYFADPGRRHPVLRRLRSTNRPAHRASPRTLRRRPGHGRRGPTGRWSTRRAGCGTRAGVPVRSSTVMPPGRRRWFESVCDGPRVQVSCPALCPGGGGPGRPPSRRHLCLAGHERRLRVSPTREAGRTFLVDIDVPGKFEPQGAGLILA